MRGACRPTTVLNRSHSSTRFFWLGTFQFPHPSGAVNIVLFAAAPNYGTPPVAFCFRRQRTHASLLLTGRRLARRIRSGERRTTVFLGDRGRRAAARCFESLVFVEAVGVAQGRGRGVGAAVDESVPSGPDDGSVRHGCQRFEVT